MSSTDDNEPFGRRIVLKVPSYMPELQEELLQYPENQWTKRMLQLANLGVMYLRFNSGATEIAPRPSKPAQQKPAAMPTDTLAAAAQSATPAADNADPLPQKETEPAELQVQPTLAAKGAVEPVIESRPAPHAAPLEPAQAQAQAHAPATPPVTAPAPIAPRRSLRKPPQMTD